LIPGEIVVGSVIYWSPIGAFINIGLPTAAFLPLEEVSLVAVSNPQEVLELNQTGEFVIISSEKEQGQQQYVVSRRRLEEKLAWERLRQIQAEDATIYAPIVDSMGDNIFIVNVEGLSTIISYIHLGLLAPEKPREEWMGKLLPWKIINVDEENKHIHLSHIQALNASKIKQLKIGQVVTGTVRYIKPYGAFIDIGGAIGLLHISEIDHNHSVDSVRNIFQVNDQVKVIIINLDYQHNSIFLSTYFRF